MPFLRFQWHLMQQLYCVKFKYLSLILCILLSALASKLMLLWTKLLTIILFNNFESEPLKQLI